MVTGASTADLAVVLIDARKGIIEQSRRHAFLVSLLRVPHMVLAMNKMDLVGWSENVFEQIADEFTNFAAKLDIADLTIIPDLGIARRQHRHPVGPNAVVRRTVAAAPSGARPHRE